MNTYSLIWGVVAPKEDKSQQVDVNGQASFILNKDVNQNEQSGKPLEESPDDKTFKLKAIQIKSHNENTNVRNKFK